MTCTLARWPRDSRLERRRLLSLAALNMRIYRQSGLVRAVNRFYPGAYTRLAFLYGWMRLFRRRSAPSRRSLSACHLRNVFWEAPRTSHISHSTCDAMIYTSVASSVALTAIAS